MKQSVLQRRMGRGRLKECISPSERIFFRSSYTYRQVSKGDENCRVWV